MVVEEEEMDKEKDEKKKQRKETKETKKEEANKEKKDGMETTIQDLDGKKQKTKHPRPPQSKAPGRFKKFFP